jgi:DNA invertase Pin-like site-specific DNA recombinase
VKRKVRFTAVKEGIRFEGRQDLQTKVMIALFGLFAEVERDLISERTKEGLVAARARGRLLGRPKGSLGTSKLDGWN